MDTLSIRLRSTSDVEAFWRVILSSDAGGWDASSPLSDDQAHNHVYAQLPLDVIAILDDRKIAQGHSYKQSVITACAAMGRLLDLRDEMIAAKQGRLSADEGFSFLSTL